MNNYKNLTIEEKKQYLDLSTEKKMTNLEVEDIKNYYLIVSSLLEECIAEDTDEAKRYIGCVIPHYDHSDKEIGEYYADYAWDYDEYIEEGEDYPLYSYAKHEKIKNDFEKGERHFDPNVYLDVEKLGKDLLILDDFREYYYREGKDVFEFAMHNRVDTLDDNYIDPDVAVECYEQMIDAYDDVGIHEYGIADEDTEAATILYRKIHREEEN